jgi:pimeloyl-ACP methyl ester carboxylesterase
MGFAGPANFGRMTGRFESFPTGTLYVHDFGGTGAPIVAVHGLGGAHLNWLPVADRLRRTGHLLAPDLPGFGYSPPRPSYTVRSHARAITEIIERLDRPATLIGNSLGGLVAIRAAHDRPDLVQRMVLVAPAGPPRLDDHRLDPLVARRLVMQGLPIAGPMLINRYWKATSPAAQLRDTLAVVCAHPERIPTEVIARSLELAAARRRQPWAVPALVRSGRSAGAMLAARQRLRAILQRITAPTLIVQGAQDRIIPGSGVEWIASVRPDWKLEVMDDCGHCPQLEAPARFADIFDRWIDEQANTPRKVG